LAVGPRKSQAAVRDLAYWSIAVVQLVKTSAAVVVVEEDGFANCTTRRK